MLLKFHGSVQLASTLLQNWILEMDMIAVFNTLENILWLMHHCNWMCFNCLKFLVHSLNLPENHSMNHMNVNGIVVFNDWWTTVFPFLSTTFHVAPWPHNPPEFTNGINCWTFSVQAPVSHNATTPIPMSALQHNATAPVILRPQMSSSLSINWWLPQQVSTKNLFLNSSVSTSTC